MNWCSIKISNKLSNQISLLHQTTYIRTYTSYLKLTSKTFISIFDVVKVS